MPTTERTWRRCGDAFLVHCEARRTKADLAAVTVTSYRRVLDRFWRPRLGPERFCSVKYSALVAIADGANWSKKTYNNAISVLRRAFKFGYRDYPDKHNPTLPRFIVTGVRRKATTMSSDFSPDCGRRSRLCWS